MGICQMLLLQFYFDIIIYSVYKENMLIFVYGLVCPYTLAVFDGSGRCSVNRGRGGGW